MESVAASTLQTLGRKKGVRVRKEKRLQRHQYASEKALQNNINQWLQKTLSPTFIRFITISKRSPFNGIKLLNSLPQIIKNLSDNCKQFQSALKKYLYAHSFYSAEYFNINRER